MKDIKTKDKKQYIVPQIPPDMVYEKFDGKEVYYKGYKDVINLQKKIEEIIGSSKLQALLIDLFVMYLHDNIDRKKYKLLYNELGLHLNDKNNLSADVVIFNKAKLLQTQFDNKYSEIPPKIVIEFDTKADLSNFDNIMDYYQIKTKKLFNFGVEKVYWVLTKNKQIIEAIPNENWLIKEWNINIEPLENISFSIDQLLKEDGTYDLVYC